MTLTYDKKTELLEETISNFMTAYPWFERRLNNMAEDHRTAIGILLEQHPELLFHLNVILKRNLQEDGFEMKKENTWWVTHEEYVLLGMIALFDHDDDIIIKDYKQFSGILDLSGNEFESTISQK